MIARESREYSSSFSLVIRQFVRLYCKMSYPATLNAKAATREHVLAVSRDFISQPRLGKNDVMYFLITIYVALCLKILLEVGGSISMEGFNWVI